MVRGKLSGLAIVGAVVVASASADGGPFWNGVSNVGAPALWVVGIGLPLLEDGAMGRDHAARVLDGFIVNGVLTEGLKWTTREPRPDGIGHDSFPSGHTSASFEVAAAESFFHPRQAPLWYGAATLVGASRLELKKHHFQDVVAGAALGYLCGHYAAASRHGWIITPLVDRNGKGLMLSARF